MASEWARKVAAEIHRRLHCAEDDWASIIDAAWAEHCKDREAKVQLLVAAVSEFRELESEATRYDMWVALSAFDAPSQAQADIEAQRCEAPGCEWSGNGQRTNGKRLCTRHHDEAVAKGSDDDE